MNQSRNSEDHRVPRPWQPRFGIGGMLMVMLVLCVTAAAGSYLARSLQSDGRSGYLVFILFTLAAPMLLMVVVSLFQQFIRWQNRRR